MAHNLHRIFQVPRQDLPPTPLPATVASFPAPLVNQTPPPPPPLLRIQEGGDVHLQAQLYAQDYSAKDENDDILMVHEVDDYGSQDEK
ncbi:hypothetical protein BGZ90_010998 [Linnemannia elongata]|nr:hypothetical protein BGZ90_010998 [Linnemannia elongata]